MNNQEKNRDNHIPVEANTKSKKATRKALVQLTSYADIISETEKIKVDSPRSFEEYFVLFDFLRKIKDVSKDQITHFFDIIEDKLGQTWIPFLTKMAVGICQTRQINDSKFIFVIRTKCKSYLESYGITESNLTSAEKNLCLLKNGKFVTEFLADAEKKSQNTKPIAAQDLACLSFICFSLYARQDQQERDYIKTQLLIDRAVAEYFSFPDHARITEKDLAGKSLGRILSGKTFSPKNISELTFLYRGTTDKLSDQADKIRLLEEINQDRISKINHLMDEITTTKKRVQELEDQLDILKQNNEQLEHEKVEAENMLCYETNKFQKLLESRESGIAEQIAAELDLELQALRDLTEYLGESDQRRFRRRLDRIDRYLEEFGGK